MTRPLEAVDDNTPRPMYPAPVVESIDRDSGTARYSPALDNADVDRHNAALVKAFPAATAGTGPGPGRG